MALSRLRRMQKLPVLVRSFFRAVYDAICCADNYFGTTNSCLPCPISFQLIQLRLAIRTLANFAIKLDRSQVEFSELGFKHSLGV